MKPFIFFLLVVAAIAEPKSFRLIEDAAVMNAPANGAAVDIWTKDTRLTSNEERGALVRITGYFPNGRWQKTTNEWWIDRKSLEDITPPAELPRQKGAIRTILVDKSRFTITVTESVGKLTTVLFSTRVGLGIDECLTQDEGGRCYYTEAGTYKVEFKVYDPDGIEWCIPKSMEKEARYRKDVASGQRCFRGSLGKVALNIGKTYAIHGTSNPRSIGKRSSHGCIRVVNADAERLFRLMRVGDPVLIVE
ncbi:hypothetical protein AGMMS50229_19200 [Campylobacterota bacterium]|nr:hypothetical protein AGMMS50229_19200 [Campylobacterota bacterium]